mmetsp:Transcript_11195/g.20396  ORF Transcript_11195/g.20396 Transcript_11195/m.20396 type:complete len:203 (-) Transcript_11195:119-727(-)
MGTVGICGSRPPQTGGVSPQLAEAVLVADRVASQMATEESQSGTRSGFEWPCAPSYRAEDAYWQRHVGAQSSEATPPPWEVDSLSSASYLEDDGEGPDSIRLKTLTGGEDEADDSDDVDDASSGDFAPRDVHPLLVLQRRSVEANSKFGWTSGDDHTPPYSILGEMLLLTPVASNGHGALGSPNVEGSSDFSTSVGQVEFDD